MGTSEKSEQSLVSIERYYARGYWNEHLLNQGIVQHYHSHLGRILPLLNLPKHCKILDAGCGLGYLTNVLEDIGFSDVFALDLSLKAAKITRERAISPKVGVSDIKRLPFADNSFDAIFAFEVLEHLPDSTKACVELKRILRPSGYLLLLQQYREDHYQFMIQAAGYFLERLGIRRRKRKRGIRELHLSAKSPWGWKKFIQDIGLGLEHVIVLSILPPFFYLCPKLHDSFYDLPLLSSIDRKLSSLGGISLFFALSCIYIARKI